MHYFQPISDIDLDGRPEVLEMVTTFLRTQWRYVTKDGEIMWPAVWALTDNQVLSDGAILRWGPQGTYHSGAKAYIVEAIRRLTEEETAS